MPSKKRQAAPEYEPLSDLAENLAVAMSQIVEHPDTCEWLRMRLAELHSSLMSEFVCDVADDIRLRFALGVMKACANDRPAD